MLLSCHMEVTIMYEMVVVAVIYVRVILVGMTQHYRQM